MGTRRTWARIAVALVIALVAVAGLAPRAARAEGDAVAKIGDVEYGDLASAFENVKSGETIVLTDDIDISGLPGGTSLAIEKGVAATLDLNGQELRAANRANLVVRGSLTLVDSTDAQKNGTGSGKILAMVPYTGKETNYGIIQVSAGGSLVMESGLIDCASQFTDHVNNGQRGITIWGDTDVANFTMNGGKIVAGWSTVSGNGNHKEFGGTITVNGGVLESVSDYAINSAQAGGVTISGGTVTGAAGAVHMQRGELKVTGGELTSTGTGNTGSWNDGTSGAGCSVVWLSGKYGEIDATVSEGAFVAQGDAEMFHTGTKHPVSLKVGGGSYNEELSTSCLADGFTMLVGEDGATKVMTEAQAEASGGAMVVKGGKKVYYTTEKAAQGANPDAEVTVYVASVDGAKYESVSAAIAAANGKTVTLVNDVQESVTVPDGTTVTLDLAGRTLSGGTAAGKAAITNNGTLTLKDTSERASGRVIREDDGTPGYYVIDNQGTMTVESGTIYNNAGDYLRGASLVRNGGVSSGAVLNISGGTFEQEKFIVIKNDDNGTLNMTGGVVKAGPAKVIDGVEYTPSGVQNWCNATISGGEVTGAVWTATWSEDLPEAKTVITGEAKITGDIIIRRDASYPNGATPRLEITGGTLSVDTWDIAEKDAVVEVSGGTFTSTPPADEYVVPGSGLVKDENGNYVTVKVKLAFASEAIVDGTLAYDVKGGKADQLTEADLLALVSVNVESYAVSVDASALPALNRAIAAADTSTEFSFEFTAAKESVARADSGVDPLVLRVKLTDSAAEPAPGPDPSRTVTVTFDTGLGSSFTQEVEIGSKVERPVDPEHEGWEFVGWFTARAADGTLSDEWAFDEDVVEGDMTLYGGWVKADDNDRPAGLPQAGDATMVVPLALAGVAGVAAVGAAVALRRRNK